MAYDPEKSKELLEDLSYLIKEFEGLKGTLVSRPFVDTVALLNHRVSLLDKQREEFKNIIKVDLLTHHETSRQGTMFEALLKQLEVTRLDTKMVKEFLGDKLPMFQTVTMENRLDFKPRS